MLLKLELLTGLDWFLFPSWTENLLSWFRFLVPLCEVESSGGVALTPDQERSEGTQHMSEVLRAQSDGGATGQSSWCVCLCVSVFYWVPKSSLYEQSGAMSVKSAAFILVLTTLKDCF